MKSRLTAIAVLLSIVSIFIVAPFSAAAQTTNPFRQSVTGTVTDSTGAVVGTFSGTATVQKFVNDNGNLAAVVKVAGTLTNNVTGEVTKVKTTTTAPAVIQQASCTILDLDIGAIHLNLLGLVIDIAPIHIDITAVPGGGLLGDLLCAIANLLNGGGALNQLITLLNQLLNLFS